MKEVFKKVLIVSSIVIALTTFTACNDKVNNSEPSDTSTTETVSTNPRIADGEATRPGAVPSEEPTNESVPSSTTNDSKATPAPERYLVMGDNLGNSLTSEMSISFLQKSRKKIIINREEISATNKTDKIFNGKADMGIIARQLTQSEKALKLNENVFGYVAFAVAVNNSNKVKDLSVNKIKKILTGEIKNWSELGGDGGKINLFMSSANNSDIGKMLYKAVNQFFDLEKKSNDGKKVVSLLTSYNNKDQELDVINAVSQQENAIGIISFKSIDNVSVYPIDVDGIEPSIENLLAGKYNLSIPFTILSKPDLKPDMKDFVDYIMGPDGQKSIEAKGYYPVYLKK